ncbi:MAG: ABC transporter permease subunit [Planctomycetota bacterium]
MNPALTTLVLARQTVVRLLKSRMLWFLLLGVLGATAVFYFASRRLAHSMRGDTAFGTIAVAVYMQFVLPFGALYFGVNGLQGDIEDRTSVYLFSRPLSRTAMLLGKWLAAALVATVLVVFGLVLLHAALAARGTWRLNIGPPVSMLASFAHGTALAALAYAGLGVWFGAWLRRPLIFGIVFLSGWEGVIANAAQQASARALTVSDSLRRLLWHAHAPRDQYAEILLGPLRIEPDPEALDPSLAMLRFAAITVALGAWIYGRREYDARTAE